MKSYKKLALTGSILLIVALSAASSAFAAGKAWYSQFNNKGWYQWEGQSSSASKTDDSKKSSLLQTSQTAAGQTQYGATTSAQGANQVSQPTTIFQGTSSETTNQ